MRLIRAVLPLVALLAACDRPALADPAIGGPAPEFSLRGLDGAEVSLAGLRGKTVVLEWANPNCPFWRRHAQEKTMQRLADEHAEVVWLGIDSTSPSHGDHLTAEAFAAFLGEHGIRYPVLRDPDGAVGRAYGAKTTPHLYVIDGEGRLVYAGAIDDDPRGAKPAAERVNYVDGALERLAAGENVEPAATRPYGCSVKYAG